MLPVAERSSLPWSAWAIAGVWVVYFVVGKPPASDFLHVPAPERVERIDADQSIAPFVQFETLALTQLSRAELAAIMTWDHRSHTHSQNPPLSAMDVMPAAESPHQFTPVAVDDLVQRIHTPSSTRPFEPIQVERVHRMTAQALSVEPITPEQLNDLITAPGASVEPVLAITQDPLPVDDFIVTIQWPEGNQAQQRFYQHAKACGLVRGVVISGGKVLGTNALLSELATQRRPGESEMVRQIPAMVLSNLSEVSRELASKPSDIGLLFFKHAVDRQITQYLRIAQRDFQTDKLRGTYAADHSGIALTLVSIETGQQQRFQLSTCSG
jgi:hypothetical protein